MAIFYLKDEDTNETLILDDYIQSFNLDMPSRNFDRVDLIGGGSSIRGNGSFKGRTMKAETRFVLCDISRRDEIIKWFSKPFWKNVYLYRNYTEYGLEKLRVYTSFAGGEPYTNYNIADTINLEIFSPDRYFTKISSTTINSAQGGITEEKKTITVDGSGDTPFEFKIIATADFGFLRVKLFDYQSFSITYNFQSGIPYIITTYDSELRFYVGASQTRVDGFFSLSSVPFNLDAGDNDIYVTAQTSSLMNFRFFEKRL